MFKKLCLVVVLFSHGLMAKELLLPSVEHGALVYKKRCILCHGIDGDGRGALPDSIEGYPDTSFYQKKHITNPDDLEFIKNIIIQGALLDYVNDYMPPWGDELSWIEIESVAMFYQQLVKNPKNASKIVEKLDDSEETSFELGRKLYKRSCVLCHGDEGDGAGKMARIIKDPKPFNLTKSKMSADDLRKIIALGGEKVGRSASMPAWDTMYSDGEIDMIIDYIITLRNK